MGTNIRFQSDTWPPELWININISDSKVLEIKTNDHEAASFARALVIKYDILNKERTKFWRYMDDIRFYVDMGEPDLGVREVLYDYMLIGDYEPETTKIVKKYVKAGDVCVDVGASVGYFTTLMAKLTGPSGKVYSFEPTPNLFRYLQKNISDNEFTNIQAIDKALFSRPAHPKIHGNATGRDGVTAITLDSLNIPKIDFIKIDIDGCEPEALKGMIQTIERSPDMKMVIEYYPKYILSLGHNPQDMMDILDKYFTYVKIGDYTDTYWNYFCTRK